MLKKLVQVLVLSFLVFMQSCSAAQANFISKFLTTIALGSLNDIEQLSVSDEFIENLNCLDNQGNTLAMIFISENPTFEDSWDFVQCTFIQSKNPTYEFLNKMAIYGVVFDARNKTGCTALMLAIKCNNQGAIRFFVEHGIFLTEEDISSIFKSSQYWLAPHQIKKRKQNKVNGLTYYAQQCRLYKNEKQAQLAETASEENSLYD